MNTFKLYNLPTLAMALSFALPIAALSQNQSSPPPGANEPVQARSVVDPTNDANDATKPSRVDAGFMKEAAMGGMAEVELGRVALQNAGSDEVRRFGQQMIDDHGKGNEELKSLAKTEGVTLPTQLDAKHVRDMQRMQKLTGTQFDREYMKMMLEDHHKDIKAFTDEGFRGDDPEVKGFALRQLPVLNGHLVVVKHTLSALDGNAGRTSESAVRPDAAGRSERPEQ